MVSKGRGYRGCHAMHNLAVVYERQQDFHSAMRWYRKAAEKGEAESMHNIGTLYMNGQGVAADYATGLSWLRKAAEAGSSGAMLNLGVTYSRGQGVAIDRNEALRWLRKAKDAGHPAAQQWIDRL